MFVNKTTQLLCTVVLLPWLSCILHEGPLSLTPHPRPTEDVTEAMTAIERTKTDNGASAVVAVFVTAVVGRAGHGENIFLPSGLQSPDLPLGAKVQSTTTMFGETLPHLQIANLMTPDLGQSRRHYHP